MSTLSTPGLSSFMVLVLPPTVSEFLGVLEASVLEASQNYHRASGGCRYKER